MNFKELIKTKTFWAGLSAITVGIILCFNTEWRIGVPMIFAGLSMVFVRKIITKK